MVKLRHPVRNNRLNELNRLVWYGLLLLVSGSAAILIVTDFFSEPLIVSKNFLLIATLCILLILYLYHLVRVTRKLFKNK